MNKIISHRVKKETAHCFKRVAVKKCFYWPDIKEIPKPDDIDKLVENFIKKYPELKKENITIKCSGPSYRFNVGDTIPNNMPVKNIVPLIYYKIPKIPK